MKPGACAHERDACVQDGVTNEMHDVFIVKRSYEAQRLAAKDASGTRRGESQGQGLRR
jgi:hypothetical protein